MKREAYAAARIVSPRIHEYFERRLAEARSRNAECLASLPDAAAIEAMIDAAFWASLRREEGYLPRISLAFLSPGEAGRALLFEKPLALSSPALGKVAPAVERPGIHLGVWDGADGLQVWGTTRTIPRLCLVLEVAAPGLLVIKHHSGEEDGKYVNVVLLEGDTVKVVDDHAPETPECPKLLTSLLGFTKAAPSADSVNVLVQLAVSMRQHGRGGCLLVVPAGSEAWRESILAPLTYSISPPFSELARMAADDPPREELTRVIDWVAGLTAVDGAVLINDGYEVLGFGAKIARRRGAQQVEQVMITEPIKGQTATHVSPADLGGTRHLSAAQFVHDQHDAVALVASQDGRFTIFEWSPCDNIVHGHRVEALLL